MIERRNIIKLLGDRTNVYHSAVLTCFTFDPIFFVSVYLPTLRTLGISNVIVLMDAGMYDQLLSDSSYQYHSVATNNYTLVRQENIHGGVFHPKMVMLFGEEEGVLIVGSGNLTFSGLLNNEEVWNVFHVKDSNSIHYPLFHKAWGYVKDNTNNASPLIQKQINWIIEQSVWLQNESNDEMVIISSGDECYLLFNSSDSRIIDDIYSTIGDANILEITVISPFYDTEGNTIKELQSRFNPEILKCVIDVNRQSAPYGLLNDGSIDFNKHTASTPLHAKIIEFQSANDTWLLSGSANLGEKALGINRDKFNDEMCILLHSKKRRNYIKELGLEFAALKTEERNAIERPSQQVSEPSSLKVYLFSCEEKDNKLYLCFNKSGIKGTLTLCDVQNKTIFSVNITTQKVVVVDIGDKESEKSHFVVLREEDIEISNRILVIKELSVERHNPDPKRRKLASLLDDTGLRENLSHILGYIEFDDMEKTKSKLKSISSAEEKDDEIIVTQDRFNELKDSKLSISLHSGVRILNYLKQILFIEENKDKNEDGLLTIDAEGDNNQPENENVWVETVESIADEANKMRSDVVSYLKRMQQFLIGKTKDQNFHGELNTYFNRPKLIAVPGLNAASSFAVAARSVVFLMNKYGYYVSRSVVIRDLLVKCAGLFFCLYANEIPAANSHRSRKIREMIKDGTVDLLSALSFFGFRKDDYLLPQLILNSLDPWKEFDEFNEILPLYEGQLTNFDFSYLNESTINRIREVAEIFINKETPIETFSIYDKYIYVYRNGHGFLVVDNIKNKGDHWNCIYHSPWFDEVSLNTSATKYKGYADL